MKKICHPTLKGDGPGGPIGSSREHQAQIMTYKPLKLEIRQSVPLPGTGCVLEGAPDEELLAAHGECFPLRASRL